APAAVALHVGGATARRRWSEFESLYAVRNRWATIVKNAPVAWLVRNAPLVALAELASLARAALRRELPLMLRAYRDVVRSAASLRAKRREAGATAVVGYRELRPLLSGAFVPAGGSLWRFRRVGRLAAAPG